MSLISILPTIQPLMVRMLQGLTPSTLLQTIPVLMTSLLSHITGALMQDSLSIMYPYKKLLILLQHLEFSDMMALLGYLFEILQVISESDTELLLLIPLETPIPRIDSLLSPPTPLEVPTPRMELWLSTQIPLETTILQMELWLSTQIP